MCCPVRGAAPLVIEKQLHSDVWCRAAVSWAGVFLVIRPSARGRGGAGAVRGLWKVSLL